MFQFHSGSIKRMRRLMHAFAQKQFQFHSGSIKSPSSGFTGKSQIVFQFHSGSIKSAFWRFVAGQVFAVSIP